MNKITQITRKAIFDEIRMGGLFYIPQEISEVEFWGRLYNLQELPSSDRRYKNMAGDMYQHRINNLDWDDYWFLSNSSINIMGCPDIDFLKFLSETLHPLVMSNEEEIEKLLTIYNKHLTCDSFEITIIQTISGKKIYGGVLINNKDKLTSCLHNDLLNKKDYLNSEYLNAQIDSMRIYASSSPEQAIGLSKEIIESFCKAVLENEGETEVNKFDFPTLISKLPPPINEISLNYSKLLGRDINIYYCSEKNMADRFKRHIQNQKKSNEKELFIKKNNNWNMVVGDKEFAVLVNDKPNCPSGNAATFRSIRYEASSNKLKDNSAIPA